MRLRLFAAAAGSAALVFVLVLVPASFAVQRVDGVTAKPDWFDSRAKAAATPTAAQRDAVAALVSRAGAGTRVTWDHRFGTPRTILNAKGYLSGPSAGSAVDVARAWVDDNRAALGLSAGDVQALAVTRDHALPGTGTHVVDLQQVVAGVQTVAGGRLIVAVTANGRVLSYAADAARSPGGLDGAYALTPAQALAKVAASLAPGVAFTPSPSGTEGGYDVFARGPFATVQRVGKAAFLQAGAARPAYRVLFVPKLDEGYDVVVDAGTGAVLYRRSLVAHESEGSVYENFPGAPQGGTQVTRSFGPTPQSPGGYTDPTGLAGIGGPTTFGNNANTYANYSNFLVPADQGPRPVSPTSQFEYPYAMNWQHTNGQIVPPSYALDLDPAATNLFWQHNRIHDEYYDYGFNETAGNFQLDNFGKGGSGGDAVLGLVHAGAASGGAPTYTGRDNAYFLEQPDGVPSWSGMFLWEPINDAFEGPFSDGNFDASVVQHEYTHGLSTRYVGGGEALNAQQSGSMGEGWSDWYALNHLYDAGLQSKAVVGEYVTGNATRGIRNWDYDHNPLGFGDIGYDLTGPEVHADGEIWTATLWDLRKALVAKYGAAKGAEVAARLVTDGMPLTAPDPSFLDARDGILAADLDRYHGDDYDTIWTAFAHRGAGASATSQGGDDTDPHPAFDHPAAGRDGTLVGTVVDAASGAPVANARVIVGDFEARVTPLARTSSTGGFSAKLVSGSYDVIIQAPGYGAQTFKAIAVGAGATKRMTLKVAPNLASKANGATIVSASSEDAGLPAQFLIDDTEASAWATQSGSTPYNNGPDQRVTIKLAAPGRITSIAVSAFKTTTASRFEAMRDFTLQTSTDGVTWTTAQTGSFTFQPPRPTAPDLHLRSFKLAKPVQAGYMRFFIDSVQGETQTRAEAAELQVFATAATTVAPATGEPEQPFTDSGTIATGNPAAGDPTGLQNVFGVTGTELTNTCTAPPASQGADGWVSTLPKGFGDGTHSIAVTGGDSTPAGYDLDLYFLDSQCALLGSAATAAPDESSTIPGGTAYVLTQLFTGANVPFTLTAKAAA
jgi:extracellular elastinolytic metalloproteinase